MGTKCCSLHQLQAEFLNLSLKYNWLNWPLLTLIHYCAFLLVGVNNLLSGRVVRVQSPPNQDMSLLLVGMLLCTCMVPVKTKLLGKEGMWVLENSAWEPAAPAEAEPLYTHCQTIRPPNWSAVRKSIIAKLGPSWAVAWFAGSYLGLAKWGIAKLTQAPCNWSWSWA